MASKGNKSRIIKVLKILEQYSDHNNPISAEEILDLLSIDSIDCERKALYDDIGILRGLGYDIRTVRGNKKGYILANREFESSEISLIVDAIRSSGFIPTERMKSLIERLLELVSKNQAEKIRKTVGIVNSNICSNESVYNNINIINLAVADGKKITVRYKRNSLSGRKLEFTYKEMTVSPYAVLRQSEHYYLVCNNEKYDNLMNLRVDRIENVKMIEKASRHFSEVSEYKQYFNASDYARKTFNMFGGELCRIDLECNVKLLDQMIEKFGTEIFIRRDEGSELFRFSTDALISDGLIGWLMQFGGDVRVLSPKSFKEDVKKRTEMLYEACK